MIVDLILLKNKNFCVASRNFKNSLECTFVTKFLQVIDIQILYVLLFFRIFGVADIWLEYRLLQTFLFLTDSVFIVLFAYFVCSHDYATVVIMFYCFCFNKVPSKAFGIVWMVDLNLCKNRNFCAHENNSHF